MGNEKRDFLKQVTILCDTREQRNEHIEEQFQKLSVHFVRQKLDIGDYSFQIGGQDFSLSCVIERKANADELYGNLTKDRDRLEKEFHAASVLMNGFILLLEGCTCLDTLKSIQVPDWEMKSQGRQVKNIGELCYSTLKSWQSGSRYQFRTVFVKDRERSAAAILEEFYWYWHNYKKLVASRRNRQR